MADESPGDVLLSAQDITKSFGAQPVLANISLSIHEGERIGLIGRNGSGKSTLLKILAGSEDSNQGLVTRRQGVRVGMLLQECHLDQSNTVGKVLEDACAEMRAMLEEHHALAEALGATSQDPRKHAEQQTRFDTLDHALRVNGAWNLDQDTARMEQALKLPPRDRRLDTLSGGELRRVDLAATLLAKPDVLLLDEPTNHIDTSSVEWIESYLAGYRGSCVLVTHDRYFLELVVDRIVEIEFNHLYSYPGNYEQFLEYKGQQKEVEAKTEQSRQGTLRRELEWLRRGAKARTTKQKARIRRYDELEAEGGPNIHKEARFEIPQPQRLGKRILDADHLSYSIDGRVLFQNFSLIMQEGMRIGISGPNGCGKTTLIRILMGQQSGYEGSLTIGETTEFLYIDQSHEEIDPDASVLDFVSNGANYWEVNGRRIYVPAYLERLLFDMDSVRSPVRNLSGGERSRMELAKKLLKGGNFLVLDEPTNDLDLPTLRVLEDAILEFPGCSIVVSHDRYFLNRVCTHLIVFEEDGSVYFSAGNYEDYLLHRKKTRKTTSNDRKPKAKAAKPIVEGKKRLSYKEREELGGMERAIEEAETNQARLEELVNVPDFYQQDHNKVQATLNELDEARRKIESMYARWEELESRAGVK